MFTLSILFDKRFLSLESFYYHNLIRVFALSFFDIFSSIYFFQTIQKFNFTPTQALSLTAIFLSIIYFSQIFFIELALKIINKHGLRFSALTGNLFLVAYTSVLYLGKFHMIFLLIAAILCGIYIAIYFMGYHLYFQELTDNKRQGKELAFGTSLSGLAAILSPIVGGLIISNFGFGALFVSMGILLLIANIPLKYISNSESFIHIPINKSLSFLDKKTQAKNVLALAGDAITDAAASYLWPLFAFIILSGVYLQIGFMGSLVALTSIVSTLLFGVIIDKYGPKKMLKILALSDSFAWVLRSLALTPVLVFLSSTLQSITTQSQHMTMDDLIYANTRREQNLGFIMQREVTFAVIKFLFLLILGLLFWFGFPLQFSLLLTALAALLTKLYH